MACGEGDGWSSAELAADKGFISAEGRRKGEGAGGPKGRAKRAGSKKKSAGHKEDAGRNVNGLQKLFSIFKQGFLDSKSKSSNTFELKPY
jgi:hypothetical protein